MSLFNSPYNLDMTPGKAMPVVHISQYDTGLRKITFNLYQNGSPTVLPAGCTAKIVGVKPSGLGYVIDDNVSISDTRTSVIVVVTEQMSAEYGISTAQIVVTDQTGQLAGSINFQIEVEKDPLDQAVISESDYSAIYQAISETAANAESAAGSAEAAAGSATTAAAKAQEATEAAAEIEADKPVIVALSVAGAGIRTAVTQSQETGEPVTVAAQYVTADPADADAIYDALHAGKRVRFDLTSDTGGGYAVRTSATRCRTDTGGRNIMHYIVGFDRGDLCNSFTGLAALRVAYIRDTSARNSVEVVVEAVQAVSPYTLAQDETTGIMSLEYVERS